MCVAGGLVRVAGHWSPAWTGYNCLTGSQMAGLTVKRFHFGSTAVSTMLVYKDETGKAVNEGPVGLQLHPDRVMSIAFRNINIAELE